MRSEGENGTRYLKLICISGGIKFEFSFFPVFQIESRVSLRRVSLLMSILITNLVKQNMLANKTKRPANIPANVK